MESKASCDQNGDSYRAADTDEKYITDDTDDDDEADFSENCAVTNKEEEETESLRMISQNSGLINNQRCVEKP